MNVKILRLWAATMVLGLAACGDGSDAPAPVGDGGGAKWFTYERAEAYPGVAQISGLKITMADGIELSASVALPADADGNPVEQPFPVILTQTGYNKSVPAIPASNDYLVKRGYAHLSVDVRGTGLSQGQWEAFGETEQADYLAVIDWASKQTWSNGTVGTWGASFMAITQLYTAAHQHPAHKAVFAIVPMADGYRDIVFAGGQVNLAFIPAWMALVTVLGSIPGSYGFGDPQLATETVVEHVLNATEFQVPTIADSAAGGDTAYDGGFWHEMSPIHSIDDVDLPTFVVGGLDDIFQRGEPLLYEALADRVDAKLLVGPWGHLTGSSAPGLAEAGLPPIESIQLQWMDTYLLGLDAGAECLPSVTRWVRGAEEFRTAPDWPHPDLTPERRFLHADGSLRADPPTAAQAPRTYVQQPLAGVCSRSTNQWLLGALTGTPCADDDRLAELGALTYTSEPFASDVVIDGPIQADVWLSSTRPDAVVSVAVTLVHPDGRSQGLTNGLLAASHRAVDPDRSRVVDGLSIQPYHPFTREAQEPLPVGQPVLVPVEVFPTSAEIPAGARLRVTLSPSDFPHAGSPLPQQIDTLGGIVSIHHGPDTPTSVTLPVVRAVTNPATVPAAPDASPADEPAGTGSTVGSTGGTGTLPATGVPAPLLALAVTAGTVALGLRPLRR